MRVVVVLLALFLGSAAHAAAATTRYAVPGGTTGDANCTTVAADCSLTHVLQDVVAAGDEVVVMPGTYDVGSMGVYIKNGSAGLNVHGEDGRPRPTITAAASGGVVRTCGTSQCSGAGTVLRHLAIKNTSTGSGLDFWGGTAGDPVTIEDVEAVAGTNLPAILGFGQNNAISAAVIRNTTAFAPGAGAGAGAVVSQNQLTMSNVTAVATGNGSFGLTQQPNCNDGAGCTGDNATATVVNSILVGGPGGADVRTTTPAPGVCPTACFGNVSADYSNYRSVLNCTGCSTTATGSAHNQTAAPLLVDQGSGDFHQQPGSPTIDAGLDDPANGSTDPDGNPRKLGAATDIGAFEDGHPRVVTAPAANVTADGATLQGTVNPLGFATTYFFQWGTSSAYGNRIPVTDASAGSGSTPQPVSQDLRILAPGTTVHYRLVATDSFGAVFGGDQSFMTTPVIAGADLTPPSISGASVSHRRFRVGSASTAVSARKRAPVGTTFRYSLSERATVTVTIDRALPGRRVGRSCRKPAHSNRKRRRCTRYVRAGTLTRAGQGPGQASIAFSGRVGRRKLAPGSYRATIGATDAAGNHAQTRQVAFSVVR